MAQLPGAIDPSATPPSTGRDFSLIPKGTKLKMVIEESDVKETKGGNGDWYIAATCVVTEEGEHKGRKFWPNFNIRNKSEKAEQIGKADFSALCAAIGHHGKVDDTVVLHNREFIGTLGVEKGSNGYEPRNSITKYEAIGTPQVSPHAPQAAKSASAPAASSTPPWAPKK